MLIKLIKNKKAQSTLEYAVLIGVVATGLLMMRVYVKKGFQGGLRKHTDQIGDQFDPALTGYSRHQNTEEWQREKGKDGRSATAFRTTTDSVGGENDNYETNAPLSDDPNWADHTPQNPAQ